MNSSALRFTDGARDFRFEEQAVDHWVVSGAVILDINGLLVLDPALWGASYTVGGDPVSVVVVHMKGSPLGSVRIEEIDFLLLAANTPFPLNMEVVLPDLSVTIPTSTITQFGNMNASGTVVGTWKFPLSANIGALVPLAAATATGLTTNAIAAGAGTWQSNVVTDITLGGPPGRLGVGPGALVGPIFAGTYDKNETGTVGMNIVLPSFGFVSAGIAVNSPMDLTLTFIINGFTANLVVPPFSILAPLPATGVISSVAPLPINIALSLYVSDLLSPSDLAPAIYQVRNLLASAPSTDSALSYLDTVIDSFALPEVGAYSQRVPQWRLRLPYPIIIGRDQALLATVSIIGGVAPGFVIYSRARITAVGA